MTLFGYIRTSRHLQEGVAGMDPFSQELRLREAGVRGTTSTGTSASPGPPCKRRDNQMNSGSVIAGMCDIVIATLNKEGLERREGSPFTRELDEIQSQERREWLGDYVWQRTYLLLHGAIDQAYQLDACINNPNPALVSVTQYILLRSIQEYTTRLAYLVDLKIEPTERIRRAIELYHADLFAYENLPSNLRVHPGQNRETFLSAWYEEITCGKKLNRRYPVRSIFDDLGSPEEEGWPTDNGGKPINPTYQKGYQIWSAVTHGHLWAIRHYGLTKVGKIGEQTMWLPGGAATRTILSWQEIAGRLLQYAFGFAVQFLHPSLDTSTMDELEHQIALIQQSKVNASIPTS